MELFTVRIPWKQADRKPVIVAPIGDIQWAGKNGPTAKDALKRHLDRCQELGAWYIGMGDYIDFASPSNRRRLKAAALYDTAEDVIDDKALDLVQELYQDFLKPTKGRWLGLLHGHHWHHLKTGETTDQRLCQLLDARFLGTSAFVRLQFVLCGTGRSNVVLWAHHGCGGGMRAGAPLNKLEDMASAFDADVYLMGHTTKQPTVPVERVVPRWHGHGAPDLIHRRLQLVNTGGFSKGYAQGSKQGQVPMGGYVEQRMLKPASLGAPIIRIVPGVVESGGDRRRKPNPNWTRTAQYEITVEV